MIVLYCCAAAGVYFVIVLVNFIWRCKNIIKHREGEWLIDQDQSIYSCPKSWYNDLNRISKIEEPSKVEIKVWNDNIDCLNKYWIRIYITIIFKSIFFPVYFLIHWTIVGLELISKIIDKIIDKIKKNDVRPFEKMKRKYVAKPAEIQKEASSYRDKPQKALERYPSEVA